MSDPTSFSLLKRSNGFWYVLYETDGRIRWKSTHTRSKQEATRSPPNLKHSSQAQSQASTDGGSSVRTQPGCYSCSFLMDQATRNLSKVPLSPALVGLVANELFSRDAPLCLARGDLFSLVGDPASLGLDSLLHKGVRPRNLTRTTI